MKIDIMRPVKRVTFYKDYSTFKGQAKRSKELFPLGKPYPCLDEKNEQSGTAAGHYFHQDLLVAQKIFHNRPERHADVGSRIDGFVAHVASFREIEVFDVRPLEIDIPNIKFRQANFMEKDFDLLDCFPSISCLHAIEHFGLGRYGDKIDFEGHLKGLDNIYGMLQKGGKFYFSVPIGPQRIEFNAHRIFSMRYLIDLIEPKYKIDSFSYVNDDGNLVKDAALHEKDIRNNYFCNYGCGIFELTKK